ncbi:hypothetical protein EGI22_01495 [Lacihabitans sp. LS3-19]|uniref:hypothetical protein n=1 Tax=Lacihabitans sp. LS3-19 TaxID=2487335 RepID=UPI0020CBAF02|nr:hypothetical protein [Lacihabitans sp. LS3-19]MCP9766562.1 hypothetical protein [Lacihabitans sp. LS3-19]
MKKAIHILLFIALPIFTNGQNQGKISIGVGTSTQIGSASGFMNNPKISFGRFYGKNMEMGLKIGGNYKKVKYTSDITINSSSFDEFTRKSFQGAIYGRYYISNYRLRPFVLAELSLESNSYMLYKKVSNSQLSGTGNSTTALYSKLGAGFSYSITKRRNLFLDASFSKSISNSEFNNPFQSNSNSNTVNLDFRYIFGK